MDVNELFNRGMELFNADRYQEAIPVFQQAADAGSADAEVFVALCYFSLAGDTSLQASQSSETEALVRGQQLAVQLTDAAIRSSLNFLHRHPEDLDNGDVAGMIIGRAFSLQYIIVAAGLTTAYRLTSTTRTIERTMLNGTVLWDEIVGQETTSYVSLNSYDMHDYHIFDDDEKTKRVEAAKETVLQNAVQAATILGLMGREYDALMVRTAVANQMADCENGIRSMLLASDWFIAMAMQTAAEALINGDDKSAYDSWMNMQETTLNEYKELEAKYGALLRKMKRDGMRPYLNRFYQDAALVPKIEDCQVYVAYQEENGEKEKKAIKGDGFAAFLSVFAQATNQKVIPVVVFPGVFSLIFGGMLREYGVNALSIIWLVITLVITFVRSIKDASVTTGKSEFTMFMLIRFGIAIAFSLNFWLGLVPFVVLKFLSKPYK